MSLDCNTSSATEIDLKPEVSKAINFSILDSIRAIAALFVVISHCRGVLWMGGAEYLKNFPQEQWTLSNYIVFGISMFTRVATEFVIVFFVLSGFSIAYSLSLNKSPGQFYKRRLVRIYPSYLLALAWAGLVYGITKHWFPQWYDGRLSSFAFLRSVEMNIFFEPSVILKNFLYMPSQGYIVPFWSLTYEVIFYLLAPFILRRVNLYLILSLLLFLAGLYPNLSQLFTKIPAYLYDYIFVYNIYFAMGIALHTYKARVDKWFLYTHRKIVIAIMLLLLVIIYGFNIYFQKGITTGGFVLSGILGVIMIIFFTRENIQIPWLMKIGKYSYTLYITHFATIYLYLGFYWLIFGHSTPYIKNFFVWIPALFFSLLIAYVFYLIIEKPTKKILDIWRRNDLEKNKANQQKVQTAALANKNSPMKI